MRQEGGTGTTLGFCWAQALLFWAWWGGRADGVNSPRGSFVVVAVSRTCARRLERADRAAHLEGRTPAPSGRRLFAGHERAALLDQRDKLDPVRSAVPRS